MNYLAHAFLSFNQQPVLVGNMISDHVKGKKQYDYEPAIQVGIRLHRAIDSFTDEHAATAEIKKIFQPSYGLYAGAFTDIAYDYFLANDKDQFPSENSLAAFAQATYQSLENEIHKTPLIFQQMFPYMKEHNWLYNYRLPMGIQKSFAGLVRRAKYMSESQTASQLFESNIATIEPYYNEFFPLLKNHAAHTLQELLHT